MISNIESQLLPVRFSIIIPIYNAAQYLRRTLASVSGQSFTDFEAILINDGSTDSSLDICREFAREDKRFKVIDVKNGGVSKARNLGLREARGEYICFLDADDRVLPDWLKAYDINESGESPDLLCQGRIIHAKDGSQVRDAFEQDLFLNDVEQALQKILAKHLLNPPWSKCYKASIIKANRLHFLENCHLYEDLIFSLQFLQHTSTVQLLKYTGYEYHQEYSTLTNRFNDPVQLLEWQKIVIKEAEILTKNYKHSMSFCQIAESQYNLLAFYVVDYYNQISSKNRYDIYSFLKANSIFVMHRKLKSYIFSLSKISNRNTDILAYLWHLIYKVMRHK